MTFIEIKIILCRLLGAQVTIGRYGQNKAFCYYCTFTVSDYGFGFIFIQWALTSFHGKNIKEKNSKLPILFYSNLSTKMADSIEYELN